MNSPLAFLEKNTAKGKKAYVAPACNRLTPQEAKELLLRRADVSDSEVMNMLQCIEKLEKQKGPGTPH